MKNVIIVLILLAAIAGAYFYFNRPLTPTTPTNTATSTGQVTLPPSNPSPTDGPDLTMPVGSSSTTPPSIPNGGTNNSGSVDIAPIDANWQTFSSRDGSYSFQYPAKGTFAPTWEQKYIAATDANIKNFCYTQDNPTSSPSKQLVVSGISSCQTTYYEGAAGSTYRTDFVLVPKSDKQFILLSFTKKYITDTHVIGGCETDEAQRNKPACAPFNQDKYQATLEQILSTFKLAGMNTNTSADIR